MNSIFNAQQWMQQWSSQYKIHHQEIGRRLPSLGRECAKENYQKLFFWKELPELQFTGLLTI